MNHSQIYKKADKKTDKTSDMTSTIKQLIEYGEQQLLKQVYIDNARLESEVLLSHCLNVDRSYLFTWPEKTLNTTQDKCFHQFIQGRRQGTPIAHLVGYKEFWSLKLLVNEHTLIPRPETELLIDIILEIFNKKQQINILDLATGSGAIAIALASEFPNANITASDFSKPALEIAKKNCERHNMDTIKMVHSNWFKELQPQTFDLIVSNPPYIRAQDPHLQQGDLRFEAKTALVAGEDGLEAYKLICSQVANYLAKDGYVLFEHGFDQQLELSHILKENSFNQLTCYTDYQEQPRAILAAR